MGLTVGRGRINKNELAGKYLERFLEAGALHCTARSSEDAERPELHAYAEHRTVVEILWERTCSRKGRYILQKCTG
ncbi:hypothetical protein ALO59_102493 [Pseudomonas amygdali pv. mellea]|nr:hypothetical protein ALO59_102493 [Pseudomonas amygdali pv. mellea]